jgi:hypothetical protein
MNYLLKHTKLSKDINSIICKYINYSKENIMKLIPKIRTRKFIKFKKGLTLVDLILECNRIGYKGFCIQANNNYISGLNLILKELDLLIKQSETNLVVITFNKNNLNHYTFNFWENDYNYYFCDVLSLKECFDYRIEYASN